MHRLTLASAGFLTALAVPAFAADPMIELPMTAPGFDWTGYYAGLQAGYGWGQSDITGTDGEPFSASPDLDGGFVGGHVAGLWQFDQAVIGAEAELNYASIDGTVEAAPGKHSSAPTSNGSDRSTPRPAMPWTACWSTALAASLSPASKRRKTSGRRSPTRRRNVGWTVGAGVDYALTDKFVVGAQYRYYDFGSEHYDAPDDFPTAIRTSS